MVNRAPAWPLSRAHKPSFHTEIPDTHHAVWMFYCDSTRVRGVPAGTSKSCRGARVYNVLEPISAYFRLTKRWGVWFYDRLCWTGWLVRRGAMC